MLKIRPRSSLFVVTITAMLYSESIFAWTDEPQDVNICDIFGNLERWNGHTVRFEATIEKGRGTENGSWIDASACPTQIEVKGVQFPNALVFASPDDALGSIDIHDFQLDPITAKKLSQLGAQMDGRSEHLKATVVGLIETRAPLERLVAFTKAWPKGLAVGFGHMGWAPGQLILKNITNMQIEKKQVP